MKNTFTDPLFVNNWFTKHHIKALIMRVSQVSILIMTSAILTMASPKGNGQSIESTTVYVGFKNESLKEVFREIERQTDFLFSWDEAIERSFKEVSLEEGRYTVKEVLDVMLEGVELGYTQSGNYVIVVPMKQNGGITEIAPEEIIRIETRLETLITGTVRDAKTQEPLAGVNIIVKGTTRGTTTDVEGKFGIEANDNDVLIFSFIGFRPFEIEVNGRSTIDVKMEMDITALQEVIINAGYWDVKEKEKTGNISKIQATEIERQPISNPLQALQGRIPGVYIQQTTGVPGGSFNILIRGQNSLRKTNANNGNLPLYIVDGIPFTSASLGSSFSSLINGGGSPLNNLNPQDIESIEVLKDADATAIYGSRGANGVVLITTKRGKPGELKIDVNVATGIGMVNNKMDLLNTDQYLQMRNEAFANDGRTPGSPDNDLLVWDATRYTDWQEVIFGGTAELTNINTTISAGNANTQFLLGLGHSVETTVFPKDLSDRKYSGNIKLNHGSTNNKFKIDFSGYYLVDNNNLVRIDPTGTALKLAPNAPKIYDETGNLNWENGTWENPFANFNRKFESRTTNLNTSSLVSFQILNELFLKTNLGYNEIRYDENTQLPKSSFDPKLFTASSSTFASNNLNTWIVEPQLEYGRSFGEGRLALLFGSTFQQSSTKGQTISASGFSSDALLSNIQAANSISVFAVNRTRYRYNAIFGRINYNWKKKYIINFTGRRDGSSRFGPGKQFANFGAVGVAWIFSNEDLIQRRLPFLSFGKFRSSYGTTGSDQIGDYGFFDLWNSTGSSYGNSPGLVPNNLFNPYLAWEKNKKLEVGIELGMIEDRILLQASYYRNRSSNQLVGTPLPTTTGFSNIQSNFPAEVQNTGLEIEVNSVNVSTKNFKWSTGLNVTQPRNKLISYPNIENSIYRFTYSVGNSLGVVKAYQYLGVDPATGINTFVDVNEDGTLSQLNDFQALKEVSQKFYGGLDNSLNYKGFELNVFFQFVKQSGRSYFSLTQAPGSRSNQPTAVMQRWQNAGDITNIQKFTQGFGDAYIAYLNGLSGDNLIIDASFIRLKNVSLSYRFPVSRISKIGIQNFRIYIQGQNLLTVTDYIGLDPETQSMSLPPLRMTTIGIQASF